MGHLQYEAAGWRFSLFDCFDGHAIVVVIILIFLKMQNIFWDVGHLQYGAAGWWRSIPLHWWSCNSGCNGCSARSSHSRHLPYCPHSFSYSEYLHPATSEEAIYRMDVKMSRLVQHLDIDCNITAIFRETPLPPTTTQRKQFLEWLWKCRGWCNT